MATMSKICNVPICYRCYSEKNLERHHIFNGYGLREKSEEDGLWIWLCRYCHEETHKNRAIRDEFKRIGQRVFLEKIGDQDAFMKRYKVNYL